MATDAENLQTAITNLSAAIATATASPKPSYSINGQSVSWESYLSSLIRQRAELRAELAATQGPIEIMDQGV